MELRHLRYFVAVAEVLNFTKAAAKLRLAQPALSRQVADLEDELGVDLFQRSSHGVRLTEEGRLFLEESKAVLGRVAESVTKVRALARGEFGELQVGYVPPLELHILPRALAAFAKTAPEVRVVLHDLGTDQICDQLRDGTLHLAVMMEPSEEATAGIEFEAVGRYPFFVAMSPRHPLAKSRTVKLEVLAGQPLVVLDRRRNSEFHRVLKRVLAPLKPSIASESDSINSLITEIETGKRVAVVSQLFKQAVGPRLLYRPLVGSEARMCVGVAHATKGDVTPAGEKLLATIRKTASGFAPRR